VTVVVSASWTTADGVVAAFRALGPHVQVLRRSSDWGTGRLARFRLLVRSTWTAVRTARHAEHLVLLTVGYEVFVAVVLRRLLGVRPKARLVVADFLTPRSRRMGALQALLLRDVDAWACVRRGDVVTLETMFGVDAQRCSWVPFPLSADIDQLAALPGRVESPLASATDPPVSTHGYVYSAGTAHRDWGLVLDALEMVGCPAVLAADPEHPDLRRRATPPQVAIVGRLPPERGRLLAAAADVVVVALRDTYLPAGPLVLTDALALGKAVVATDVNGTRDYVEDGRTALLVPPHDPAALADAVRLLLTDKRLRERLGAEGRAWASARLQPEDFARAVVQLG
jgi:glycosyltransferase involved in cell wall biosynthesis